MANRFSFKFPFILLFFGTCLCFSACSDDDDGDLAFEAPHGVEEHRFRLTYPGDTRVIGEFYFEMIENGEYTNIFMNESSPEAVDSFLFLTQVIELDEVLDTNVIVAFDLPDNRRCYRDDNGIDHFISNSDITVFYRVSESDQWETYNSLVHHGKPAFQIREFGQYVFAIQKIDFDSSLASLEVVIDDTLHTSLSFEDNAKLSYRPDSETASTYLYEVSATNLGSIENLYMSFPSNSDELEVWTVGEDGLAIEFVLDGNTYVGLGGKAQVELTEFTSTKNRLLEGSLSCSVYSENNLQTEHEISISFKAPYR